MHVGRVYPYHPTYYATELLFWPGFAPWRMVFPDQSPTVSPWDLIAGEGLMVSAAGEIVTDATQISYLWGAFPSDGSLTLVVSIEAEEISGQNYLVWSATLYTSASPIATAWFFQLGPQTVCGVPGGEWWQVHDPLSAPDGPSLTFRPATYAEGGSPY